jgi:hypothetical protein
MAKRGKSHIIPRCKSFDQKHRGGKAKLLPLSKKGLGPGIGEAVAKAINGKPRYFFDHLK